MSRPHIKINGKTVLVHRHVWSEAHGPIPEGWEVHHIDLDPMNNALENLRAMPAAEHRALHSRLNQKHPKERPCDVCGRVYWPEATKRARSRTCSRDCFRALARRQRAASTWNRRISPTASARIRERVAEGERPSDLALEYGVAPQTINYHLRKPVAASGGRTLPDVTS